MFITLDKFAHFFTGFAVFLLALIIVPLSSNAECSPNLEDHNPAKLGKSIIAPIITDNKPIIHKWIGDWFVGWVALETKQHPSGYHWKYGIWQEVLFTGSFKEKAYLYLTVSDEGKSILEFFIKKNLSHVREIRLYFDGKYKFKFRYKKHGRQYREKYTVYLSNKHIKKHASGLYTLTFALSTSSLRKAKKGLELKLKTSRGRPKFSVSISLDGFKESRNFAFKIRKANNLFLKANKFKLQNKKKFLSLRKQAKDLSKGNLSHSYMATLLFLKSNEWKYVQNTTEADFIQSVEEDAAEIIKKYPSPHIYEMFAYILETYGYGNIFKIFDYYKKASSYGRAYSHKKLFYYMKKANRYKEARRYAYAAKKLGQKVSESEFSKLNELEKEHALKCSFHLVSDSLNEEFYKKFLNWYPNSRYANFIRVEYQDFKSLKLKEASSKKEKLAKEQNIKNIWNVISQSKDEALLEKFVSDFPSSEQAKTAKWLLNSIREIKNKSND